MDEAFACPECGTNCPGARDRAGRQVRCGFCQRLLEVPYLPRAVDPGWRRRRFGRPWWVPWAWSALGVAAALIVLIAAVRLLNDRERAMVARSIDRLIASSERSRSGGEPGAGPPRPRCRHHDLLRSPPADAGKDLARPEGEAAASGAAGCGDGPRPALQERRSGAFPWATGSISRHGSSADPDLAPMRQVTADNDSRGAQAAARCRSGSGPARDRIGPAGEAPSSDARPRFRSWPRLPAGGTAATSRPGRGHSSARSSPSGVSWWTRSGATSWPALSPDITRPWCRSWSAA